MNRKQNTESRTPPRNGAQCVVTEDGDNGWVVFFKQNRDEQSWFIDSGTTSHISDNREFFELDTSFKEDVFVANGMKLKSIGRDSGIITFFTPNGQLDTRKITDVLFVPELKGNLLSVRKLVTKGFQLVFKDNNCIILRNGVEFGSADVISNLYKLRQNKESVSIARNSKQNCIHSRHRKLGHPDHGAVKYMFEKKLEKCRKPLFHKNHISQDVLDLIHTETPRGRKYFVTFIDDYSEFTFLYSLRNKSEVYEKLKEFVEMVETQFGRNPKVIISDRGGEYVNENVQSFLKEDGIGMQYTVPFCSQQNGVAERKNRYLMEMARCMLFDAELPNRFWGETIVNVNYLQNRLPSRSVDVTPYEMWKNKKPNISHIQRFGCYAYAMIPESQRRKLDEKAVKLRFVGYDEHSKGYRLLNENSLRISIRDRQNDSHNSGMSENCDMESENISYHEGQSESQKFEKKSTRNNFGKPPQRYEADVVCEVGVQEEPKTYQEAVTGPDRMDWIDAMNDELESIKNNGTWDKSESIISELAICLKNEFELSCLGDIICCLGIDVESEPNGDYFISQRKYIQEIIQTVNLDNAKPSTIPLDSGYYKLKPGEQLENNKNYQKLIG
ncbi:hypothetical protein JTB14_034686 [Gonioctena quinquepunctata]|nr:hypothetical protein JTB14_034686 [Gonioctena quinquepunctata]